MADPNPSIFKMDDDKNKKDAQLRAEIKAMGALLGQIIQDHEGPEIFDHVEELRRLAKVRRK